MKKEELETLKSTDFLKKNNYINRFDDVKSVKICGENDKKVFVSIVMPIYDHPLRCLKNAIESALTQDSFDDYKVVIVDNDESGKNESVVLKFDSSKIVYYRNEKNIGLFGNWNRCVQLANSEWITFLHSDDMLSNDFLKTMCKVVKEHPEIDQLACDYEIYNIDDNVEEVLLKSGTNHRCLKCTEVLAEEYHEAMVTSVKGALIKRDLMLEIGGFKDKDDGPGLGDYIAMTKYAYYYHTYLLSGVFYYNGWGKNDSINVSIWYPELVSNYYMQLFFAEKARFFSKKWKLYRAKSLLVKRAKEYAGGNSFVGKVVPIDWNELKKDCELENLDINPITDFIVKVLNKIKNVIRLGKKCDFKVCK